MQGFPEPLRMTTPEEHARFASGGFEEHVRLIQTIEGVPVERARWMAWLEGPFGRIRRLGQVAEINAKQQQKKEQKRCAPEKPTST